MLQSAAASCGLLGSDAKATNARNEAAAEAFKSILSKAAADPAFRQQLVSAATKFAQNNTGFLVGRFGTGIVVGIGIGLRTRSPLFGALAGGALQAGSSYGSIMRLIESGIGMADNPEAAARALLGAVLGGC